MSLAGADHLISRREDSTYVADVIAAWAERYVDTATPEPAADLAEAPRQVVVRETRNGKFQQTVTVGPHRMTADEPKAAGGDDTGPGPYDFLLTGLGACTSMTMRMYADLKKLPMDRVTVTLRHGKIHAKDCEDCEMREGKLDQIERVIGIEGALDAEQRKRLMEIADKCPVHRTLHSEIRIVTTAAKMVVTVPGTARAPAIAPPAAPPPRERRRDRRGGSRPIADQPAQCLRRLQRDEPEAARPRPRPEVVAQVHRAPGRRRVLHHLRHRRDQPERHDAASDAQATDPRQPANATVGFPLGVVQPRQQEP